MMVFNVYFFVVIVGQFLLKQVLLLCVVDFGIGGVLVCGDKGMVKSMVVCGLIQVLLLIILSEGCVFCCVLSQLVSVCIVCNIDLVQCQDIVFFVILLFGVIEDCVFGLFDLQQVLQGGQCVFQFGLLVVVYCGIFYIDEVNLLVDYLVDVLLDVVVMGVNLVQCEGIFVSYLVCFMLIGIMNLEEGDLWL